MPRARAALDEISCMPANPPNDGQVLDVAQVFAAAERVHVTEVVPRVRRLATVERDDWLWTAVLEWRLSGELPDPRRRLAGCRRSSTLQARCPTVDSEHTPAPDLFLQLEQLEAVHDLLAAGSAARAQMALILLDGMADALIYRRLTRLYEATEDFFLRRSMPRFTQQDRVVARQRFNRRVEIAAQTELTSFFGESPRLLTEQEAAILKVAHRYRNSAYHEGAHHAGVVPSITSALFVVVASMIARTHPEGYMVGSIPPSRIAQLRGWGYETGSGLQVRQAADAVCDRFSSEFQVAPFAVRELLADDLEARATSVRKDVDWLRERGVDADEIVEGVELEAHYGADEELLDLRAKLDPLTLAEESDYGELSQEQLDRTEAALARLRERMDELEREHKRRVTLGLIERAQRTASRLRRIAETHQILVTYSDVERPLAELERYVEQAVLIVDREIEHQRDLERGK